MTKPVTQLPHSTILRLKAVPPYDFALTVRKPAGWPLVTPYGIFEKGTLWIALRTSSGKMFGLKRGLLETSRIQSCFARPTLLRSARYNYEGILLDSSSNNSICHNNFVNNTRQVYYIVAPVTNIFDDGYPSGGNYWSDYVERYPNAIEIDASGVWNTPYVIDANNTDHYPLMKPYTRLVGDVNGDSKVDMKDLGFVARRFMCVPGDPLWDSAVDFNTDGKINMMDVGTVARHFGEH